MRRIFIVFLKQMSLAQQTLALLRKVRDKKFCCCSLRHQRMTRKNLLPKWQRCCWLLTRTPHSCLPQGERLPTTTPVLPRTKVQRSPSKTHFLIEFFFRRETFLKLPMLHFHFPLIKANLCIFWVPFTNFYSWAFMHTGKLLGSTSGPQK